MDKNDEGKFLLIFGLVCLIVFILGMILGVSIERANAPLYSSIKLNQDFIMMELERVEVKEQLLSDLLKTLEAHGMELERLVIQKDGVKQLDTRID